MKEQRRKWLVQNCKGATLEGSSTSVAGWTNPYTASLAPRFGGFWEVDWETVERVLAGDKNFTARDVQFVSWQWQGLGDPVPEALQRYLTK